MDVNTEDKLNKKIERVEKELKEEIRQLKIKMHQNVLDEIEGNSRLRGEMRKADREQSVDILKIKGKLLDNTSNWKILLGVVALVLFSYWYNS